MPVELWLAALVVAVLGGCAAPEEPPGVVWLASPGAVYCYRTLAAPDCYAAPEPGAARRLIASGPSLAWTWEGAPGGSAVEQGEAR